VFELGVDGGFTVPRDQCGLRPDELLAIKGENGGFELVLRRSRSMSAAVDERKQGDGADQRECDEDPLRLRLDTLELNAWIASLQVIDAFLALRNDPDTTRHCKIGDEQCRGFNAWRSLASDPS
jgi:hypothetical protein